MNDYTANIGYNDFRTQVMSVEELLHYYDRAISLNKVGRRYHSIEQRSRFIETLLLGMPQLPFYVDDTESNWLIIDGVERIDALYSFCYRGMPLTSLYFRMKEYEGITFNLLPPLERNKILNTKIVVYVLNPGLSPNERFGIYVCLKSRMDSTTLKWARSIIYHKAYQPIEDLARRMYGTLRRDSIENRICCLLVGINYKRFLYSSKKTHIDSAANYLLDDMDLRYLIKDWEIAIREALSVSYEVRLLRMDSREIDLFNAVNYHLYMLGYECVEWKRFQQLLERVSNPNSFYTMDCAEVFCRNLDKMLHLIRE